MFVKKTIKAVVLLVLLLSWVSVRCQSVPGVIDNYSGSSAAWLNPSNISTGFVHDDIALPAVSFSLENNFAYLPPNSLWPSVRGLLSEGGTWAQFPGPQPDKPYYYKYALDDKDRNLYQTFDLALPSMMMTFSGNRALVFSLRQRVYSSVTEMPWEIPVLITESLGYDSIQHVRYVSEGMRCSMLDWNEVTLGYSTQLFDHGTMKLDAGVTGKLLLGTAGAMLNTDYLDYEVESKREMYFYGIEGIAGFVMPVSYKDNFRDETQFPQYYGPLYKGAGLGLDAGFSLTYKRTTMIRETPKSACDDHIIPYYWRFGMSLLDAGWVRFSDHLVMEQLSGGLFEVNLDDFDTVMSFNGGMGLLDALEGNAATVIDTVSSIRIGLPTALSLQADVNPYQDFYCNFTWIQPLSRFFYDFAVEREPLLSLTPRYETSFIGVSLPVSLYDYHYLTAGVFLRVGPLTFGTNDLLSLTGWGKTRSIDFMVSLRLRLDRGDCLFTPILDACGIKYRHRQ